MGYKRLNLKFAKKVLGVDFEKLMDLLRIPESDREKLRPRMFLVLNGERLPRTNLMMSRLEAMRAMMMTARRTFDYDDILANKWFNSYDVSLAASFDCKCPLDILVWKGVSGMQIVRRRFQKAQERGGDPYNSLIPINKNGGR